MLNTFRFNCVFSPHSKSPFQGAFLPEEKKKVCLYLYPCWKRYAEMKSNWEVRQLLFVNCTQTGKIHLTVLSSLVLSWVSVCISSTGAVGSVPYNFRFQKTLLYQSRFCTLFCTLWRKADNFMVKPSKLFKVCKAQVYKVNLQFTENTNC